MLINSVFDTQKHDLRTAATELPFYSKETLVSEVPSLHRPSSFGPSSKTIALRGTLSVHFTTNAAAGGSRLTFASAFSCGWRDARPLVLPPQ